ncbi:thioredoxin family protein [Halococcus sp. AFM35]|uniref:thioredoxin family protein n=1 Tax=Halococcus sp. AFM35 TaxID=3421653 RepID=UPI003EBE33BF
MADHDHTDAMDGPVANGGMDAERLVAALVDGGVLSLDADGTAATTTAFEDTRGIYHDSYASVPESDYHEAVADAFGFESTERAAARIDALGVTREEFIAFLALDSELDEGYSTATLARMAAVVTELDPETPVPEDVETLTDETYPAFVADHDRAIVTVWKHHCDPCEAMKEELDAILERIPDGVAVGGIDGKHAPSFRRAYDVDAAPAMVLFENGELREGFTGRATPDRAAAACVEAYES